MPLNDKNKMYKNLFIISLCCLSLAACKTDGGQKETADPNDSTSKAQQRAHNDSLKQQNPLLILPPDSTYTGDYIDKYPNGVIKFKGQYRFGERHGHWLSFFPSGELWSEMQYDKGKREGLNKVMREDGTLFYQGLYKNDQQDGAWDYYDEKGKLIKKVEYKADRIVKETDLP
jgi:hypothetical protein